MKAIYPTYKQTSIQWLPNVPVHWKLIKTKRLFKERSEKGFENEPLLAATQTQGVVLKEMYETRTVTAQKDFDLLKLVKVGDFVISLRSFQGGIEYAYYQGIISPAYSIFYQRDNMQVNKEYFKYFFKSEPFISSLTLFVTGIREGQNINFPEFKDSLLPLPPFAEQTEIAQFLDKKNEFINTAIAKKQRLIELFKEQKRAISNNLLSSVSAKLEKRKLKYCVKNISEQTTIKAPDEVYVGMGNIESWTGCFVESEQTDFESQAKKFTTGDILFGKLRPYLAKVFHSNIKGVCSGEFIVLRRKSIILPEFLQLTLLNPSFIALVNSSTYGAKMPRAEWAFIGNVKISVPSIERQFEIVNQIKNETAKIDSIINRIEQEIVLIKEYKQSLIAEAVTGKIKIA